MAENRMKTKYLMMMVLSVAGLSSWGAQAQAASIDYANTANCYVYFDGTGRLPLLPASTILWLLLEPRPVSSAN